MEYIVHGSMPRALGLLVAAGGLVLVSACGGGGAVTASAAPSTPPAATAAAAAPTPEAAAPTSAAAADRPLARVFPDVATPICTPAESAQTQLRTSTGATPAEAYVCDLSSVVPGAQINFAEWPDQAGAQAWYQDTVSIGPRIEDNDMWQVGGVTQGPLWTAQSGSVVVSTGVYENLPYTWEIRTTTLDESNAVFNQIRLQQSTQLG